MTFTPEMLQDAIEAFEVALTFHGDREHGGRCPICDRWRVVRDQLRRSLALTIKVDQIASRKTAAGIEPPG